MFKRYRFAFETTADKAFARLDAAVDACPGFGLAVDAGGHVRIFRNQGTALLNGFFPVFVGRFNTTDMRTEFCGRFRFHLLAIGLFAGFIGASVFSLVSTLTATGVTAGPGPEWQSQRVRFEIQFIAFAVLAALFAWLAGKPMRDRITSIIVTATAGNPTIRADHS